MLNKNKVNGGSQLLNQLMADNGYNRQPVKSAWSEVDDLYNEIAIGIYKVATEVNNSINLLKQLGGTDNKQLIVEINGFNKDIESFTNELLAIKAKHEGKTGIIDPASDDFALCYEVYNDYYLLNERFKALVFNPMLSLTEEIMTISQRKKQEQEQADAVNPNVITDVEVKVKDNLDD